MSQAQDPSDEVRFVLAPNGSLSVRGAWIFLLLTMIGTGAVAGYCTWLGFWPVLPFAGLELGALGWALRYSMQRSLHRQVVSLGEETVRIEFGMAGQGAIYSVEMPRYWTRVLLENEGDGPRRQYRLWLANSGNRVRIGQFLTDEERKALAARLQCALRLSPTLNVTAMATEKTLGDA